jgi:hypothetical protein
MCVYRVVRTRFTARHASASLLLGGLTAAQKSTQIGCCEDEAAAHNVILICEPPPRVQSCRSSEQSLKQTHDGTLQKHRRMYEKRVRCKETARIAGRGRVPGSAAGGIARRRGPATGALAAAAGGRDRAGADEQADPAREQRGHGHGRATHGRAKRARPLHSRSRRPAAIETRRRATAKGLAEHCEIEKQSA